MKSIVKKIVPIILSLTVVISSAFCAVPSAFDDEALHAKEPFVISSEFTAEKSIIGGTSDGAAALNMVQPLAVNTKLSDVKAFFNKIVTFFKDLFSGKLIKPVTPPATTKKTTTTKKKTTTTTKKTTTTTKKTTTTTRRTTTTTRATTRATTTTTKAANAEALITSSSFLNEAANAINKQRSAAGVANLRVDSNLTKAAAVRAKELSKKYDHTRPDGRSCFTIYADCGITKPQAVAENIAMATRFDNATDICNLWMGSSSHRANLVSSKYTRFGMAWYKTGNGKEYAVIELGNG